MNWDFRWGVWTELATSRSHVLELQKDVVYLC